MSWQGFLLNNFLRFGKWQFEHRDLDDLTVMMRLYMNRLAEFVIQPSWVRCAPEIVGGVPCEWVVVDDTADAEGVVLYCHGGGFIAGSPASHRDLAWRLSRASGLRVLLVGYRLAPEFPYPAPLEDALAVYRALLARDVDPHRLVLAGDSAGGNLILAAAQRLRDLGLPRPAALVAFSPWGDLTHSGESVRSNAERDHMLPVALLDRVAALYAGERDRREPLLSPVFGDYRGLPPLMLHAAAEEVLLDDARRIAAAAERDGVAVEYTVWRGVPHAFPVFAQMLPEGQRALEQAGAFIRDIVDAEGAAP